MQNFLFNFSRYNHDNEIWILVYVNHNQPSPTKKKKNLLRNKIMPLLKKKKLFTVISRIARNALYNGGLSKYHQ